MRQEIKTICLLHLMLMVYSLSGVCSKLAAGEPFLSARFCIFYGTVILLLAFYAVAVWGLLFFQEQITFGKLLGVTLVIAGVVLFSTAEQEA